MGKEGREADTDRKNLYLCHACGAGWVSTDKADGTTPFIDRCLFCDELRAQSLMYTCPPQFLQEIPARVEWYKPTAEELAIASRPMLEHAAKGGLFRRVLNAKDKQHGKA